MNKMRQDRVARFLLALVLMFGCVLGINPVSNAGELYCENGIDITGSYTCDVVCVNRYECNDSNLKWIDAVNETDIITDSITAFNEMQGEDETRQNTGLYQVDITSEDGKFTEREIGPLVGCTLYTATESVSDDLFPVLEEYIFDGYGSEVTGFTKVVRNPSDENFKTCKVKCSK